MNSSRRVYFRKSLSSEAGSSGSHHNISGGYDVSSFSRQSLKERESGESRARILILDDDMALLRLMEIRLQREGYHVQTFSEMSHALSWVAENDVDLLFLDLKLDGEDSSNFPRKLSEIGVSIPFLVITGQGDEKVAVEMMKQGALDYLVKDIKFLEFVPAVTEKALHQIRQERLLIEAEHALRVSESKLSRAQRIAQLGSFEIGLPISKNTVWSGSIETARMLSESANLHSVRMPLREFIEIYVHPADRLTFQKHLDEAVEVSDPIQFEFRLIRDDGAVRFMQSSAESHHFHDGVSSQLTGTLLDITERRKLEEDILKISDWEKKRLGQDLHDGICQHFAGIEFMCGVLEHNLGERGAIPEAGTVTEIRRLVRDGIHQTRDLARGLSPVELTEDGLMESLKSLANNTSHIFRVNCCLEYSDPILIHDNETAVHLFRIAQEAVGNAIKHGKAKQIVIRMELQKESKILLKVQDNGEGFLHPKPITGQGMGMRLIQYRANMLGGSASWIEHALPETGLTVQVVCPLPSQLS